MRNTRILTIAVVLLLLANIALIAFMLTQKKKQEGKRQGGREPFELMVKELGMSEEQKKEYRRMKEEHFKNVRPLFDSIRAAKTAFFGLIKDSATDDSVLDAYSSRISASQAELDKVTFAHFKRVRNIFTVEQQPKFDTFIQKMMMRGKRDSSGRQKDH